MWFALALTTLAGIATVIGAYLATHPRLQSRAALAVALGFSAGAILYVSLTDILAKSLDAFSDVYGQTGYAYMAVAFFVGIGIMIAVDRFIPSDINPDDQEGVRPKRSLVKRKLMRSGVFIGIALALHNFPEGFLVFMTALDDPSVGIAIAVALAIHNIPEGIAIAAPLYAATKNKLKSIGLACLTGLAEPVGAIIGYLLLRNILTPATFGWVFGIVAGMMVFIVINELLPAAHRFETKQRQTSYGFIGGMAVLAVSVTFLQ